MAIAIDHLKCCHGDPVVDRPNANRGANKFQLFSVVYCVMILIILLSRDHVYSKELNIYNKKVIDCSLYIYHLYTLLKTLKTKKYVFFDFILHE